MADLPPPYVANERWKSISRTLFQLGGALFAATVVRAYAQLTLTLETSFWFAASFALMWSGWVILSLLEPEK